MPTTEPLRSAPPRSALALSRDHGISPGDRVALFAGNCTQYLECLYGIWWIGAVAIPINAKLHGREAAWICGDGGASLVFVSDDTVGALTEAEDDLPAGMKMLSVDSDDYRSMRERRGAAVAAAARDRRSRLAVLHLGHHRPAQGRHAQPRQSGRDVAVLPGRCRSRRRRTTPRSMPRRSRMAPASTISRIVAHGRAACRARKSAASIRTKCSTSAASSTMS